MLIKLEFLEKLFKKFSYVICTLSLLFILRRTELDTVKNIY